MSKAAREHGAVAFQAEQLKRTNYTALESSHHFVPFAVETPSVLGQAALDFVQELGQPLHQATGDLATESSSCNTFPLQSREGMQQQCWALQRPALAKVFLSEINCTCLLDNSILLCVHNCTFAIYSNNFMLL